MIEFKMSIQKQKKKIYHLSSFSDHLLQALFDFYELALTLASVEVVRPFLKLKGFY